jgi:fido (protein-threonine AMPylation protein)
VDISRGGHLFGWAAFLETALKQIFEKIAAQNHLAGLDQDRFTQRAAYKFGELNAAHPFARAMGEHNLSSFVSWV